MPQYAKLQCNWVQQHGHRRQIGCKHYKRNPYLYPPPMSRGLCPIIYAENIMEFAFFAPRRWLKICSHSVFCSCGLVFFQTVSCLIQYMNSPLCSSHTIFCFPSKLTRNKQRVRLHVVQMPSKKYPSSHRTALTRRWHCWILSPRR